MSWNIDPFNDVVSATSTRIDFSSAGETINGVPVQFVLHGSFQFNQEGDVTGGTITSMEKIDASGSSPIILETITVDGGLDVRDLLTPIDKADALANQLGTWNFEPTEAEPTFSSTQIVLDGTDGTRIVFEGSGFQERSDAGTVTAIRHLDADGNILHSASGLPLPVSTVVLAMGDSDAFYRLLIAGNNTLTAHDWSWALSPGDGDDIVRVVHPERVTVSYEDAKGGIQANLDTGDGIGQVTGAAGNDRLENVNNLVGSEFDDAITGNAQGNYLEGLSGDDLVNGARGSDRLIGNEGEDTLIGSHGNDTLNGGAGNDLLNGGKGNDWASYRDAGNFETSGEGVQVSLARKGPQDTGSQGTDLLFGIENLEGTSGDDTLGGNAGKNKLRGLEGDDSLWGGKGNDQLDGGVGDDLLNGGNGNDDLRGHAGEDQLFGGTGRDRLDGGADADVMRGGGGNDTYIVDNIADIVLEVGREGFDVVQSSVDFSLSDHLERLELTGNDDINGSGNDKANAIFGNEGDNWISGGGGKDYIWLGEGMDIVIFDTMLGPSNVDRIADFTIGEDSIRLESNVFRALSGGGLADNAFNIGGQAETADHHIIYHKGSGALFYDADGAGGADQVRFATLSRNLDLTSDDFFIT